MFQSATFKLTAWYVLILVSISLLYSFIIYTVASSEIETRLNAVEQTSRIRYNIDPVRFGVLRDTQVNEARGNLIGSLLITNIAIWITGGIGSYYLARRSLEPIEHAHEAQSRFTSDASHELRTPLASMKTEIEVALRDKKTSTADLRLLLASNLEEIDKLSKLSQVLLQFSRLEYKEVHREKLDISKILSEVTKRLDKEGRTKIDSSRKQTVYANEASIEELVTILLDNALKYSPKKSAVTIATTHNKQMAGFLITNEGKGIAKEHLTHIFDRFYRGDSSRTNGNKSGYGLGLALAKKIVELHNGELSVTSGEDELTTFTVLLPRTNKRL